MALFLTVLMAGLGFFFMRSADAERGVLGGPANAGASEVPAQLLAALSAQPRIGGVRNRAYTSSAVVLAALTPGSSVSGSFQDINRPRGIFAGRGEVIGYTVKRGDTLSSIAVDFGVSVQTITAVNPGLRARALQIGQKITILPTSGILYEVKGGETLESIAEQFSVSIETIREYNRSADLAILESGAMIVIPGAEGRNSIASQSLPNLDSYFVRPTQGHNWGRLHNRNAVDIANTCGTPIAASAEGLVVDAGEGWNSGYGNFILIEHPNGTKTRYAHLTEIASEIGEYVKQGDKIGTMGATGNVHGPTGCHLHFEVDGARNPFMQ